MNLHEGNKRRV